jgi:transposase
VYPDRQLVSTLGRQIEQVRALNEQIKTLERQISCWQRRAEDCQRIGEIPGALERARPAARVVPERWDGHASARIADEIVRVLSPST